MTTYTIEQLKSMMRCVAYEVTVEDIDRSADNEMLRDGDDVASTFRVTSNEHDHNVVDSWGPERYRK